MLLGSIPGSKNIVGINEKRDHFGSSFDNNEAGCEQNEEQKE
jgi:hypothetical protein